MTDVHILIHITHFQFYIFIYLDLTKYIYLSTAIENSSELLVLYCRSYFNFNSTANERKCLFYFNSLFKSIYVNQRLYHMWNNSRVICVTDRLGNKKTKYSQIQDIM